MKKQGLIIETKIGKNFHYHTNLIQFEHFVSKKFAQLQSAQKILNHYFFANFSNVTKSDEPKQTDE